MNKSDTERGKITLSLEQRLIDRLKQLSASTRIPQYRLMDEAIEDLLRKYGINEPTPKA